MFGEYKDFIKSLNNDQERIKSFLKALEQYSKFNRMSDQLRNLNTEELEQIFKIVKGNPQLQIDIWATLPNEIVENSKNLRIFETVLDNKFGEYLQKINKKELVKILNGSRTNIYAYNEETKELLFIECALLIQLKSPLFDNEIATEAFSFEQLLEIVSNKNTERALEEILTNPNSIKILKSIGQDGQSWRAKLKYLIGLDSEVRTRMIDEFADDEGELVKNELKRREEAFEAIEKGYMEYPEYGVIDIDIEAGVLLQTIFGITVNEAKNLIKKYGTDIDHLDIQREDEKRAQRKIQIMRELINLNTMSNKEAKDYYSSHIEEFLEISREVTVSYKVDLEKSFLDLYARQYDRALEVETRQLDDTYYNGKNIKVYEASGDFTILIRGEQNVSPENEQNFWNSKKIGIQGLPQSTIAQGYIRTVSYEGDNICYVATTSCKDGELRMASTTNIKSKETNIELSNIGINSDFGNGIVLRAPREQINNSRGPNNETITTRNVFNSKTGLIERKPSDFVVYIQETNDTDINQDPRFKTAQFVASETGWPILIIPREKCAQREMAKIAQLKDKLLGKTARSNGETDATIIQELIVKFNNNREGILTSQSLKGKYFTEAEHIELIGVINERLSQVKANNPEEYESLVQTISGIYKAEIDKYYAFSYDRDDAQKELDINLTREHLKPYEDFLLAHERNMFNLTRRDKNNIYNIMRNISQTTYYDMNEYHSLEHIRRVIMFAGILAKNEKLSRKETKILLAAAAFHDSGRAGEEGEYDNHAIESAKQVGKYFKNNPKNPFGITTANISIIQAVIRYHEYREQEKGVTDRGMIEYFSMEYNVDPKKIESLVKISELLKDADALDRARFGKKSENRWSLDAGYLKSDTAKSISMLRFSERCNDEFKTRENQKNEESQKVYSEEVAEQIFENELNEFNRPKIQMSSLKNIISGVTAPQKKSFMEFLRGMRNKVKNIIQEFSR